MENNFKIETFEEFMKFLDLHKGIECNIYTHEGGFDYIMRVRELPLEIVKTGSITKIGNKKAQLIDITEDNYKQVIVYFMEKHHNCN